MRLDFAFLRTRDRLFGGRADGIPASRFDSRQLRIGTEIELEHTDNRRVAEEIARDHLTEDPLYYDKLRKAGL